MRFLLITLLCVSNCLGQQEGDPKNIHQLWGSALETIKNPDVVYAVLLKDKNGKVSERTRKIQLERAPRDEAVAILLSNNTYGWDIWKPCLPVYGARLIFHKGTANASVDFCFDCDILSISASGRGTEIEDFDPQAAALLRLFQRTFPKDRAINGIK